MEDYIIQCTEILRMSGFFQTTGVTPEMYQKRLRTQCEWLVSLEEGYRLDNEEMELVMKAAISDYVDIMLTKFVDLGIVDLGIDDEGQITYKKNQRGYDMLGGIKPAA